MKNKKSEELKKYLRVARGYTDGLGKKMDPGIIRKVALLNALGFVTEGSCEGHVDPKHGDVVPWVHVAVNHNKQTEAKVRQLVRSYWQYRMSADISDLHAIWMHPLNENKKKKTVGTMRIQPGPEVFYNRTERKDKAPRPVLKWFLEHGQNEMKAFTKYLELVYTGKEKLIQNPPKGQTVD